jgi:phage-related protein
MVSDLPTAKKPVEFVGSAREDLRRLPKHVTYVFGYAIFLAECGEKHPDAKPLKGFGGADVLEVVDNYDGDTYRAVYTVKFEGVVYVLDAFQKKPKRGSELPKVNMERIKLRLKTAQEHYKVTYLVKRTG